MKKIILSLLSLVVITGLYSARSMGAGSPPAIDVSVALLGKDKKTTETFMIDEPVTVVISLENVGTDTVIAQEVFLNKPYHLELHFTHTRPDGTKELITANVPYNLDEPKPPRVKLIGGKLRQLEGVVFLKSGWAWSVDPFNALDHYRIDRTGHWSVKAVISNRTYLRTALVTYSGKTYAKIAEVDWSGDLESNPVNFEIIGDWDKDGYFYPQLPSDTAKTKIDCNDYDVNVNPGAAEISNNGIDDDCNPATPDKVTTDDGTIRVKAVKYTLSWERLPLVTRNPVSGIPVRAYDMSSGSCAKRYGISWHHHETIWNKCTTPYMRMTGADGQRSLELPPGVYLLIAKYDPDLLEAPGSDTDDPGNDIFIGVSADGLKSNQTLQKYFAIIGTNGEITTGICHVVKGSELLIIQPQYLVWDGNGKKCPFIFESRQGTWTVTTELHPPKGFEAYPNIISVSELNTGKQTAVPAVITQTKTGAAANPVKVEYTVMHDGWKEAQKVVSIIDMISN